ncbi:MAG: hypothetical protein ACI8WM_000299 [Burkholderiaceae bacterium]|jgi:hypothetical protein
MSMNFSASEHWTDGWRENSLMPNDVGLRRCTCGQFVLVKNMTVVDAADSSELPYMGRVSDELLSECISKASSEEMEVAARLGDWRHRNHVYRQAYRQHRDTEEAATKTSWVAANPDRRTWWDKLRRRKPPSYSRQVDSPFTYPAFEATDAQLENMKRLSEILQKWRVASRPEHTIELAELYREQGRFYESLQVILTLEQRNVSATSNLIGKLIKEKESAPMCYSFYF